MFAITEAKGINLTLLVYELLSSKGDYAGQIMANRWLSWKTRKSRHKAEETCLLIKILKLYGENRDHFRGQVIVNVSLYKQALKKKTFEG